MTIPTTCEQQFSMISCLCFLVAITGCGQQQVLKSLPASDTAPFVSAKDFSERVSNSQVPLLVEFSVPVGCYRCDQMRSQFEQISSELDGRVDVCRLNLNFERDLVAQLGIKVCPTYVAFDQGKEVFRVAFPTSGEMLLARLDEIASTP